MTTILEALNAALLDALGADPSVVLMGEDILDPYGGAFKVTRGCSDAYPDRVIPTPISEAGLAGIAAGMALRGMRPVLEIMFGDFSTLLADQIINHMTKFRWMYNDSVELPLVIRAPMGGRRGYGPTHSQSLEKLYLGVPGLTVLAPASIKVLPGSKDGPGMLLERTILETNSPVLFVENKLQYLQNVQEPAALDEFEVQVTFDPDDISKRYPVYHLAVRGASQASVTLTAYGAMADLAMEAMYRLAYEHEIFTDLVIPTRLAPFNIDSLLDNVKRSGRLLTIEEGTLSLGWGAEVLARAAQALGKDLRAAARVAALDLPVPASLALEKQMLPQVDTIIEQVRKMV